MEPKTRSILEEIISLDVANDRKDIIASRANNLIESAIRLIELMEQSYTEDEAANLTRKMLNSIKSKNSQKFRSGFKRINNIK
jgi:hypothetical protein